MRTLVEDGSEAKIAEAEKAVRAFHEKLCATRVLDPACGTGNFLYVTLDLFKRLEAEVVRQLRDLRPETGASGFLDLHGVSVTPRQLLGIEVKRWAKEIAELVLWIGWLQWHFRTHGDTAPDEPVLRDYGNIECRDAVLAWDRVEPETDAKGRPVTRWDGETTKPSPVTGEPIPDETARVVVERYVNPRKAEWPEAEFVVGNPPFVGNKRMRAALGDGYVEALRNALRRTCRIGRPRHVLVAQGGVARRGRRGCALRTRSRRTASRRRSTGESWQGTSPRSRPLHRLRHSRPPVGRLGGRGRCSHRDDGRCTRAAREGDSRSSPPRERLGFDDAVPVTLRERIEPDSAQT